MIEYARLVELGGGRYRVERVLGKGGQKTVYLVHDTALERACALSWIEAEMLDASDSERMRREALALAKLAGHPHIVTLFDIGEEAGRPFIVSEYVAGGDLASELARAKGPLPVGRALVIAGEVLEALAAVHEAGLVHRDLKPSNVWLDARGRSKLGDFGLALGGSPSRITESGLVLGTPAYVSPEQLQGLPVDGRSDLYALGCMLFELLTGRTPFAGSALSLVSQHLHAVPEPPSAHAPNLPLELDHFVLRLLAKSSDERFASAREAQDALLLVRGAEVASTSGSMVPPVTQPIATSSPGIGRSATKAPSAAALLSSGKGDDRPAHRRAARSLGVALLLVGVGAGVVLSIGLLRRQSVEASLAAPLTSANPEAARLFALGDRLWRTHSLVQAIDVWTRAVAIDPELAPAHLRLALESIARQSDTLAARKHYRAAAAATDRLDDRDRALLGASAPMFEPASDAAAWLQALEVLEERYPQDGELLYWKSHALLMTGQPARARGVAQAAIAADPGFLQAYTLEWSIAADHQGEDQEPLLRRCADRFPQSGSCAGALVWLAMSGSDCEELDELAGKYAARVPDHFIGDRGRALAFHARGEPAEAVAELLQRAAQLMSNEARNSYGTLAAELAIASGDLEKAERERRAELDRLAGVADAGPRALAVARLADVIWEQGRADEARAMVRDFVRREVALSAPITGTSFQHVDGRAELLSMAWRTGALPAEELERRKAKLLEAPLPLSRRREMRALLLQAPEEAVSVADEPMGPHEAGSSWWLRGRALALLGRPAEAIGALRQALGRCDRLTWALDVPRARLLLAELLERTGDRVGAAVEYRAVVSEWARARPRSMTREEAHKRLTTLSKP